MTRLHTESHRGWFPWESAAAIHSAVSIIEEIAGAISGDRSKKFDHAVHALRTADRITEELGVRMTTLYVSRNRTPGAGHGVGRASIPDAGAIVIEALSVTRSLLEVVETERQLPPLRLTEGWRAVFQTW